MEIPATAITIARLPGTIRDRGTSRGTPTPFSRAAGRSPMLILSPSAVFREHTRSDAFTPGGMTTLRAGLIGRPPADDDPASETGNRQRPRFCLDRSPSPDATPVASASRITTRDDAARAIDRRYPRGSKSGDSRALLHRRIHHDGAAEL